MQDHCHHLSSGVISLASFHSIPILTYYRRCGVDEVRVTHNLQINHLKQVSLSISLKNKTVKYINIDKTHLMNQECLTFSYKTSKEYKH